MIAYLGPRVKRLRVDRTLTLEQLAARTGVSKSMISKIERGDADPTTNVLSRIAEGLDVSISQLIGGAPGKATVILRHGEQPVFRDPETGFERRSLSPLLPSRGIDFVLNSLPPAQQAGPFLAHQPGVEEYLAVAEGTLELRLANKKILLKTGDSLLFDGNVEHHFRNAGKGVCRYYIVIDSSKWR